MYIAISEMFRFLADMRENVQTFNSLHRLKDYPKHTWESWYKNYDLFLTITSSGSNLTKDSSAFLITCKMVRIMLNFGMDDDVTDLNTSLSSDDSGIHSADSSICEDSVDDLCSPCKRSSPWYGDEDSPAKRRAVDNENFSQTDLTNVSTILDKINEDEETIGDMSRPYCLPTITGKHPDLKAISAETMVKLLQKNFSEVVEDFAIVDCRYPYEYEGGHIKGAINVWDRDTMSRVFDCDMNSSSSQGKKKIIIFSN